MVKWQVGNVFDDGFQVEVSLDVSDGNTPGTLQFSGQAEQVAAVKQRFDLATGAFGHSIRSAEEPITAFDADAVLRQTYDVEVIEGAEVFAQGYETGLDDGELT